MAVVDVKGIVDFEELMEKLSQSNIDKGLFYMLDAQALPDMNNYVPLKDGTLRMSGHVEGNDTLVWDTPYAMPQYTGTAGKRPGGFVSDRQRKWFFANLNAGTLPPPGLTTPGTGPFWDQVAFANHGDAWVDAFLMGAGLK